MGEPDWKSAVRVELEPLRAADLLARMAAGTAEPSVWVTDLIDPRPAYYRRRVRVPVDPERRARQAAGRQLHAMIGSALAAPGYLEVRVRREGIVGQIDLLEKEPTELKTTQSLPDPTTIQTSRGAYLEQLAMYCALTGRIDGRLVVVEASEGMPHRCQVFDVRFRSSDDLLAEVRARASAFREADSTGSPRTLPRCAWYGRGCEFQQAGVCECRGDEPLAPERFQSEIASIVPNDGLARSLEARLSSLTAVSGPVAVERFRDLLYPRRAYYERRSPPSEGGESPTPASSRKGPDLYRRILDALEGTGADEVTRVPVPTGEPLERVPCLDGRPYLLKVTRFPRHHDPGEILERQPHYLLELGFRCALVGVEEGWLLIGYELAEADRDRLRVYRVRYAPVEVLSGIATDRIEALTRALREGRPESLPACPAWMVDGCPYRDRCGCGGSPGPAVSAG